MKNQRLSFTNGSRLLLLWISCVASSAVLHAKRTTHVEDLGSYDFIATWSTQLRGQILQGDLWERAQLLIGEKEECREVIREKLLEWQDSKKKFKKPKDKGKGKGKGRQLAPPQNLVATSGIGQVTLQWDAIDHPKAAGYRVYRKVTEDKTLELIAEVTDVVYVDDTTVSSTNYYAVAVYDSQDVESTLSAEVQGVANQPVAFTEEIVVASSAIPDVFYSGSLESYANDPEGDAISFTLLDGPEWLSVAVDGSYVGTPSLVDAGENIFTVQAESLGGSDTVTLSIQVLDDLETVAALGELAEVPAMYVDDLNTALASVSPGELKAVFFDGLDYQGNQTLVYAYVGLPAGASVESPVPGVVLVHGGGGTAFSEWVTRWMERGYAAISIAVEGQIDRRITDAERDAGLEATGTGWLKHAQPGPVRSGIYQDSNVRPLTDQWMYHAVADTILANSLLRSLPEVRADDVGLMGVSWGGVITSTVIGIDTRFKFAVPTYGCGNLDEALNVYGTVLSENAPYQEVWDPMVRIANASMPVLWYSWPTDWHFPLDCVADTYSAASGPHMLSLVPGMGHGHGAAWVRPESYDFADSVLAGSPWCLQESVSFVEQFAEVRFASTKPLDRAVLVSTFDDGHTGDRIWHEAPANLIDNGDGTYTATALVPDYSTAWFINVLNGESVASSDYQETGVVSTQYIYNTTSDWDIYPVVGSDVVTINSDATVIVRNSALAREIIVNDSAAPVSASLEVAADADLNATSALYLGRDSGAGLVDQYGSVLTTKLIVNESASGEMSQYTQHSGTLSARSVTVNNQGALDLLGGEFELEAGEGVFTLNNGGFLNVAGGRFVKDLLGPEHAGLEFGTSTNRSGLVRLEDGSIELINGAVYGVIQLYSAFEVMGGLLDLGSQVRVHNVFTVNGSASTIRFGWLGTYTGAVFNFNLDATGVSPVEVNGWCTLANSDLVVNGAAYRGGAGMIPLVTSANTVNVFDLDRIQLEGFAEQGLIAQIEQSVNGTQVSLVITENQPPVFGSERYTTYDLTVGEALSASLAGTATDPEGDLITYRKVSGPEWLLVGADGTLSGVPSSSDVGLNEFVVEASAIGGSGTAVLAITVLENLNVRIETDAEWPSSHIDSTNTVTVAGGAVVTVGASTQENLIVNGSFEEPDVPTQDDSTGQSGFGGVAPGKSSLIGWTVADAQVYVIDGFNQFGNVENAVASDGDQFVQLQYGSVASVVSQDVTTTVGALYELSFDCSALWVRDDSFTLRFRINGVEQSVVIDANAPQAEWSSVSVQFEAVESTTTISFIGDPINGFYGPSIDNVRLYPVADTNLVVNGSFEDPAFAPDDDTSGANGFLHVSAGSSVLTGWSVEDSQIYVINGFDQFDTSEDAMASDGSQFIQLQYGSAVATVSQSIPTVPGEVYELSFDYGALAPWSEECVLSYQLGSFADSVTIQAVDSQTEWSTLTVSFQAVDTSTVIAFTGDTVNGFYGPSVDNVSVRRLNVVVAEAASLIVNDQVAPTTARFSIVGATELSIQDSFILGADTGAGLVTQHDGVVSASSLLINGSSSGDLSMYTLEDGLLSVGNLAVNSAGVLQLLGGELVLDAGVGGIDIYDGGSVLVDGGVLVQDLLGPEVHDVSLGVLGHRDALFTIESGALQLLNGVGSGVINMSAQTTLSGGDIDLEAQVRLWGTLCIRGSEVEIDAKWFGVLQDASIVFELDASGVSPILVNQWAQFSSETTLHVDGTNYAGGPATLELLTAANLVSVVAAEHVSVSGFAEKGLSATVVQDQLSATITLVIAEL